MLHDEFLHTGTPITKHNRPDDVDDMVLHDEFLHTLRLFLDLHDYAGKKPTDPLIVQRGRKKWAKENADGEIVQSEEDED